MFWFYIIAFILGALLLKYVYDYNRDNHDLQDQSLDQKFSVVVNMINEAAFGGRGTITKINKRGFNLYEEGQNQIVEFSYGTGHLYIIWKYKYFQKEVVHKRQFPYVRNLSIFEQEDIAKTMIKEMDDVIINHKEKVNQGYWNTIDKYPDSDKNRSQVPKYDSKTVQQESLERLAKFKNLPIDKLKENFISEMEIKNITQENFNEILQFLKNEKQLEAEGANIDPNDTASAFLESWLFEYIEAKKKGKNPYFNEENSPKQSLKNSSNVEIEENQTNEIKTILNRANNYYEKGENQNAIKNYLKVLDNNPGNLEGGIFVKLGKCYYDIENYENALKYFCKADKSPSFYDIFLLYDIASTLYQLYRYEDAIRDLKRLIINGGDKIYVNILLAKCYLEIGDTEELKRILDNIDNKISIIENRGGKIGSNFIKEVEDLKNNYNKLIGKNIDSENDDDLPF